MVNQPTHIADHLQASRLLETIRTIEQEYGVKVRLVVLDTLARCFAGADENRAADMNLFIAGCDRVKVEARTSILVIHHSGKNEESGARGSSALKAAADYEFALAKGEEPFTVTLRSTKTKDSAEVSPQLFSLKQVSIGTDEDGDAITTLVSLGQGQDLIENDDDQLRGKNLSDGHQAIWQAVRSRMASGESTDIALIRDDFKAQGFNANNFNRRLDKLLKDGHLVRKEQALLTVTH